MFYGSLTGFGGGHEAGFISLGATFDGSNDYMGRSTTGDTDTKLFAMSAWCTTSTTGSSECLTGGNCGVNADRLLKLASNIFDSTLKGTGGGHIRHHVASTTAFTAAADTWIHIAVCCDLVNGTSKTHMFINGTEETTGITVNTGTDIDHTCTNMYIGAGMGTGQRFTGAIAEVLIWTDEYIDWSAGTNILKVRSAAGKPVDPGTDGSLISGTAPNTYCSIRQGGAAVDFDNNRGSGGDFTITGALALHSSNPSD